MLLNLVTLPFSMNSLVMSVNNIQVEIYDITDKKNPNLIKKYELYEPYYTTRCINNELYVIASGKLRKEKGEIITYYKEDNNKEERGLNNIRYLKELNTKKQTLISVMDLDNTEEKVKVNSYLMDISNAYVSENAIYLLDEQYENDNDDDGIGEALRKLFGLKGVIEFIKYKNTNIYNKAEVKNEINLL